LFFPLAPGCFPFRDRASPSFFFLSSFKNWISSLEDPLTAVIFFEFFCRHYSFIRVILPPNQSIGRIPPFLSETRFLLKSPILRSNPPTHQVVKVPKKFSLFFFFFLDLPPPPPPPGKNAVFLPNPSVPFFFPNPHGGFQILPPSSPTQKCPVPPAGEKSRFAPLFPNFLIPFPLSGLPIFPFNAC